MAVTSLRAPSHDVIGALRQAGGVGLVVTALDGDGPADVITGPGPVLVGTHRRGQLPADGLDRFDILVSADPSAPRPWVGVAPDRFDATITHLRDSVARQPVAASVAAHILRMSLALPFDQALMAESLGYSMLLASASFLSWRAATPASRRDDSDTPRVRAEWRDDVIRLILTRPDARNAVDSLMRDALVDALECAALDPRARPIELHAEGPAFSAGGDLGQFGEADDVGLAHLVRTAAAPTRQMHRLRERTVARLHGACIGAGIEIPAAAGRVTARPGAFFRLPEVSMGLVPGAGGMASIPRRIGRRRTCYMAISGLDVDVATALAWGLIDEVDEAR
jgi:enoyl-CoA hydratase/carnithine racemase